MVKEHVKLSNYTTISSKVYTVRTKSVTIFSYIFCDFLRESVGRVKEESRIQKLQEKVKWVPLPNWNIAQGLIYTHFIL